MLDGRPFVKLSGAGNDFIVLAERDCRAVDPSQLARALCPRGLSLGADGLIIVGEPIAGDVPVRFYNPDGSRAELCGNGSRCAARYAVEAGLVPAGRFRLLTDAGALDVEMTGDARIAVAMPEPEDVPCDVTVIGDFGSPAPVHALCVGVPHAVVVVPDVEALSDTEITAAGRRLRYDPSFPCGVNVDFVTLLPDGRIRQRTYERGVEALTKACGTGATASAHVAQSLLARSWPVTVCVDGGVLTVDRRDGRLWLEGNARVIATGRLGPDALSW